VMRQFRIEVQEFLESGQLDAQLAERKARLGLE